MNNLYEINNQLSGLLEVDGTVVDTQTGEIYTETQLAEIKQAAITQTENFGLWIKNQASLIEAIRAEEKAFAERRRYLEDRLERAEKYLAGALKDNFNGKFETAKLKMGLRKSERVEITDPTKLDLRFKELKMTETVNKAAIKAALKDGETVDGAELVACQNLQIK